MRGYTLDKDMLGKRLARIEGQVRGVATMVADDRYCIDIVTQLKATRAALAAVEAELLKAHVSHCITAAVASGDNTAAQEKLDELLRILPRAAAD